MHNKNRSVDNRAILVYFSIVFGLILMIECLHNLSVFSIVHELVEHGIDYGDHE